MPSLTNAYVTPFDPVHYAVHNGLRLPGPLLGPHRDYCGVPVGPIDECVVCRPYWRFAQQLDVHRYDRRLAAELCEKLPHCDCGEAACAELVDGSFVCADCMGEDDDDGVERYFPWVRALCSLERRSEEFDWDVLGSWGQHQEARDDEGSHEA